jgi:hypothetical protein
MKTRCAIVLLAAALAAGTACNKKKETPPPPPVPAASAPAVSVVAVTLGKEVGSDKKVTAPSDTFTPSDTIYASVDTQGTALTASLSALWKYQDGQTVHEETQPISPAGAATTEFHISKPDGWPTGDYSVEIRVNGVSARKARFRVG